MALPTTHLAWTWKSPDQKFTYQKRDGKWGGPDCGLGYGGRLVAMDRPTFSTKITGDYVKIEFHDGHRMVGEAKAAPW